MMTALHSPERTLARGQTEGTLAADHLQAVRQSKVLWNFCYFCCTCFTQCWQQWCVIKPASVNIVAFVTAQREMKEQLDLAPIPSGGRQKFLPCVIGEVQVKANK